MASTTDFNEWLENNAPDSMEEAYNLYQATNGQSEGIYEVSENNGMTFIKGGLEDTLALVSESAKAAFRKRVEDFNPHPELGWEGALAFDRAMQKND